MTSLRRGLRTLAAVLLFLLLLTLVACGAQASPPPGQPAQGASATTAFQPTRLFTHSGYNYAPSVIADGARRQVWWCGHGRVPGSSLQTDVIYYRWIDTATGAMSPVQMVFWPAIGQWDGQYTCDPSVLKGSFQYNGATYTYALYYTATDRYEGNNRIGLAFSNDGVTWVRYPQNPLISPSVPGTPTYGAGQAATYRDAAGNVVLFHTDVSANGVFVRTSADGVNFSDPTPVSTDGAAAFGNNDFAYDPQTNTIYAAIELPGRPGDRETDVFCLYRIAADQVVGGHWEKLATIDTSVTGAYLNHSPGFVRDGSGLLDGRAVEMYFSEGNNKPDTWTLYSITWK